MRQTQQRDIWSVSALNRAARELLESGIGVVWIEAEVSNLARPASGHLYFSLKDAGAQLRAAFFRQRQRGSAMTLADGDKVLVRGKLSVYEPRGDYQLIVEHVEPAGEGALRRAFEVLKLKLAAEGLFGEANKQPLPDLPRCIGVITSPSGAAIRDVLQVLKRRMPAIPVIVYAASVQGAAAPAELRRALSLAIDRHECDVLMITRGGGSLEDLAAFNDESLARAIAGCPIPIISGVGHEVDVTISDFVADVRAPTPSAAAEMIVPDQRELIGRVALMRRSADRALQRRLDVLGQRLDQASRRIHLQNPASRVANQQTQLAELKRRLQRALTAQTGGQQARLEQFSTRLLLRSPLRLLAERQRKLADLRHSLVRAQQRLMAGQRQRVAALGQTLNAVSPLATLARGYAIVRDAHGEPVTAVVGVKSGAELEISLRDGRLEATVTAVSAGNEHADRTRE